MPPTTPPAMAPTGVEDSSCGGGDVADDCAGVVVADSEMEAKTEVEDMLGAIDEEDTIARHRVSMSFCVLEQTHRT